MFAIDLNKDPRYNRRIVLDCIIPTFTKIEGEVVKELRKFAEKSMSTVDTLHVYIQSTNLSTKLALPSFVVEEEERATTRYLSLTTIATFFSSITATTLQFSYQQSGNTISDIVNLAWFISLVFSISSGVNGILSMTWRKSIV